MKTRERGDLRRANNNRPEPFNWSSVVFKSSGESEAFSALQRCVTSFGIVLTGHYSRWSLRKPERPTHPKYSHRLCDTSWLWVTLSENISQVMFASVANQSFEKKILGTILLEIFVQFIFLSINEGTHLKSIFSRYGLVTSQVYQPTCFWKSGWDPVLQGPTQSQYYLKHLNTQRYPISQSSLWLDLKEQKKEPVEEWPQCCNRPFRVFIIFE